MDSSPAVQQSTPTTKMTETPAALDSALEATTAADARAPSAAAETEIVDALLGLLVFAAVGIPCFVFVYFQVIF